MQGMSRLCSHFLAESGQSNRLSQPYRGRKQFSRFQTIALPSIREFSRMTTDDWNSSREEWEKADWLADVVERRLAKLADDPDQRAKLTRTMYDNWRKQTVERTLLDELFRGDHSAYMRFGDEFHPIDRTYWLGALLQSSRNAADGRNGLAEHIRLQLNTGIVNAPSPKQEAVKQPTPSRATNRKQKRLETILKLFETHPDFDDLTYKDQLRLVEERVGKEQAKSGFGRTTMHNMIGDLREQGKIPPKNVQK